MTPSPQCSQFIRGWESCKLTPYRDAAGWWTIGWGHLMDPKDPRVPITQADADALFEHELLHVGDAVDALVPTLHQCEYDACVSLSFNIGVGAFSRSTLLRRLNDGGDAASQFLAWDKVTIGGVLTTSKGLHRRRYAEMMMYEYADYSGRP